MRKLILTAAVSLIALVATLAALFHDEHERSYGYRRESEPIALVNLRLKAFAAAASMRFAELSPRIIEAEPHAENQGNRVVYLDRRLVNLKRAFSTALDCLGEVWKDRWWLRNSTRPSWCRLAGALHSRISEI